MSESLINASSHESSTPPNASNGPNALEPPTHAASTSILSPGDDSGLAGAQELHYFPEKAPKASNERTETIDEPVAGPSNDGTPKPGGRPYSREELLHLKKSPLVAPPPGMPQRKDWFGCVYRLLRTPCETLADGWPSEYNEQTKAKDHDLSATRMRYLDSFFFYPLIFLMTYLCLH